jgi:hypothetical protein
VNCRMHAVRTPQRYVRAHRHAYQALLSRIVVA